MKKTLFSTLFFIALILTSISLVSASDALLTTTLEWKNVNLGEETNTEILKGESATFEWYVSSHYDGLTVDITLTDEQGTILRTYEDKQYPEYFPDGLADSAIETITINDYQNAGKYFVEVYARAIGNTGTIREGRESITLHVTNEEIYSLNVDANPRQGTSPLSTQLTCSANGGDQPIEYSWNLGDGSRTYTQNPTHVYTTPGIYTAICTAEDNNGDSRSGSVEIIVETTPVNIPPQAEFTWNPNSPIENEEVQFTSTSYDIDGYITNYEWDINNDGTYDYFGSNPRHRYTNAGTYQVTLRVTDNDGARDSVQHTIIVREPIVINIPPKAEFVWNPNSPIENEEVQFTSTSYDVDGYITNYEWDINNDGTYDYFGSNPRHTFVQEGSYLVSLRVTDNDGARDSVQHTIIVQEEKPEDHNFTNIFVTANPNQGRAPLYTQLSCTAIGGDAPITYFWNLGDGSSTTVQNPTHTYTNAGRYTATCVAEDVDGDIISGSVEIITETTPVNIPPQAEFVWYPNSPVENEVTQFVSTSIDIDGYIVSYEWDINNDGTYDYNGASISHTFTNAGIYVVSLRVRDNDGERDTVQHAIIVQNKTPEDHNFTNIFVTANPNQGEEPLFVDFTCEAIGGDAPITYFWFLGDGSISNTQNPDHTYVNAGTYTATCVAKDKDGETISGTTTVTVEEAPVNNPPEAEFIWYPNNPYEGEEVQFISTSVDADGYIVSYEWDFDDGTESTERNPRHTFTDEGTYTVYLYVEDNEGANDYVQHNICVKEVIPEDKDFTNIFVAANPNQGEEPLFVDFTCEAIGGDAPINYYWNLGDGSTAYVQNPDHTYAAAGTYTATCVAEDIDGDTISDSVIVVVEEAPVNNPPEAEFIWYPNSPVEDEEVQFVSTSYDVDGYIVNYEWDMGDGNYEYGIDIRHSYDNEGIYIVSLRVTDNDNAADIVQHSIIVRKGPVIDHNFTKIFVSANPNHGIAPLYTELNCQAIGGDAPITYSWNLGDGSISNTQNPTHTYANAGTYTAMCTAEDVDGDTISGTTTIVVAEAPTNIPPVAIFDYLPGNPEEGETVSFDASNSYDVDGHIVNYQWDFDNDGNWDDTGRTSTYQFTAPGEYVTLRVIDDENADDTMTRYVPVSKKDPEYNISAECNPDVVQGKHEYCVAQVRDINGDVVEGANVVFSYLDPAQYYGEVLGTCITNFKGDCHITPIITKPVGNYVVQAEAQYAGTAQTGFKVWTERYDIVGLEIYSDDEYTQVEDTFYRSEDMYVSFGVYDMIENRMICDDSLVQEVFMKVNNLNKLSFVEDSLSPSSKAAMEARLSALTGGDVACSYEYMLNTIPLSDDYLGDGRVFAFAFNFSDNSAGQSSKIITVLNNPVQVNLPTLFNIHKQDAADSESIIIDVKNYVSDVETATIDMEYQAVVGWNHNTASGSLQVSEIGIGVYRVTATSGFLGEGSFILTVSDTDGSRVSDFSRIMVTADVHNEDPVAIIQSASKSYTDTAIIFDGSTSYDPDGTIVQYDWNFGDGTGINDGNAVVSHSYAAIGTYTISLTVTDNSGNTDSTSVQVSITNRTRKPACSDGKDNDGDGLIDMEDPGCTYPSKDDEGNIGSTGPEKGLKIRNIEVVSDSLGLNRASAGDLVVAEITVENFAGQDLDNIRIGFSIPELGVKHKSSQFSLDDDDRKTKKIVVYIPYDAAPGEYYTEITAADGDIRRSTHGLITIK